MNNKQIAALVFALITALPSFAKGHACGHAHHAGGYVGHHSSRDKDVFTDMRKNICSGYIVYDRDTLSGIITCVDNSISVKTSDAPDSTLNFKISDKALVFASLQDNGQSMELVRLENNKLYRVLHTGKLSIYDACFSFNHYSMKFYEADSRMKMDDRSVPLNKFFTTSVKRKLIQNINKTYGLALSPKEYRRPQLLHYIESLN